MDEQALIDRWRTGYPEAAHTLVARYYPRMLNLYYRLTGSREQAEELTQDLFVRLTQHVARGGHVEHLSAWMNRTALNLWRDHLRRLITARQKGITTAGGDEAIAQHRAPDVVEDLAMTHWEQETVRRAVLNLSPAHREAVVLHHYHGLSYDEIATLTDVPLGTVRSRIHYAVKQLRSQLGPEGKGGIQP